MAKKRVCNFECAKVLKYTSNSLKTYQIYNELGRGGGVWGLNYVLVPGSCIFIFTHKYFVITVLKNHRWYGYARYKVCPLLCDTYLESAHNNFPVIFKYMPIST